MGLQEATSSAVVSVAGSAGFLAAAGGWGGLPPPGFSDHAS